MLSLKTKGGGGGDELGGGCLKETGQTVALSVWKLEGGDPKNIEETTHTKNPY